MTPATSIARRLRRHWALWVAVALFLVPGVRGVDTYGHGPFLDRAFLLPIGNANLDYVLGEGERAFDQLIVPADRYYGAVVEAPLSLAERLLDGSPIFANRAFLTHLFFLAGGVFCYLLVWRLFNNRLLALLAMVLFLLHPRIYAHSFYNSKDVPFLVMFMIALSLVHRAFRRETLGAFILCGVGVGLLVNLRVMGLALFAAVLVLRALDLAFAGKHKGGGYAHGGRRPEPRGASRWLPSSRTTPRCPRSGPIPSDSSRMGSGSSTCVARTGWGPTNGSSTSESRRRRLRSC